MYTKMHSLLVTTSYYTSFLAKLTDVSDEAYVIGVDVKHKMCYYMNMNEKKLLDLYPEYDRLQKEYGSRGLHSIYHGGCICNPDLFFVFMNPTAKNVASSEKWTGLRAPWIGTKRIWELFVRIGRFDEELFEDIKKKKADDWTPEFAESVYQEVSLNRLFISNFAKCTRLDAKKVSDTVYREYLPLLEEEISIVKPHKVILLGNQVSSLFLGEKISVSKNRKKKYNRDIMGMTVHCYPVFYPVGNGYMNIDKAVEDLKWIIEQAEV